uniref:Lipocalin/cytosolic fatty-acid binding domain-containing protein n=1 Tax=Anopheles epiroticus TaxID=199890 RepID=A0A182PKK2_9DIPT
MLHSIISKGTFCHVFLLHAATYGIIVPWKSCPEIEMDSALDYDCDLWKQSWQLEPLAHIPGGASSMTLFHNPYQSINCVYFEFFCRKDSSILGDLYLSPVGHRSLVCPGFSIVLEDNTWQLRLFTNPNAKECQTVDRWLSMDIFAYRQNDYIFVYSCRQRADNLPVIIGAWILGDRNASEQKRANILQDMRKLSMKIPGFRDDWWFYPKGTMVCESNATCDYLANCKISADAEEMLVPSQETSRTMYMVLVPVGMVVLVLFCFAVFKSFRGTKVTPA